MVAGSLTPVRPSATTDRLRPRRLVQAAAGLAVVLGLALGGTVVPAEAGSTYSGTLRGAVNSLPVAAESNSGYDRDRQFGDWKDANRDCQNTRAEVLIQESRSGVSYTSAKHCTVKGGTWVTTWDAKTHRSASSVQIDHTVPVHEAWGSGARHWSKDKRGAFYNDLGDRRTLNAQTSRLNAQKQARGPEAWMPTKNRCAYVADWTAVKIRWGLKADRAEKDALIRIAGTCPSTKLTVARY